MIKNLPGHKSTAFGIYYFSGSFLAGRSICANGLLGGYTIRYVIGKHSVCFSR